MQPVVSFDYIPVVVVVVIIIGQLCISNGWRLSFQNLNKHGGHTDKKKAQVRRGNVRAG